MSKPELHSQESKTDPHNSQESRSEVAFQSLPFRQIQQLAALEEKSDKSRWEFFGLSSPFGLAPLVIHEAHSSEDPHCHLIVTTSEENSEQLRQSLLFFDPEVEVALLSGFDVEPYSTLYPSPRLISERLKWLHQAQRAKRGQIFIASIQGLAQYTIPFESLHQYTHVFRVGSPISDETLARLTAYGYLQVPSVDDVGHYSLRGGIFDIFSPAHDFPVRLELFGETIESIRFFDPETQRTTSSASEFSLIPNREIVLLDDVKEFFASSYRNSSSELKIPQHDRQQILQSITRGHFLPGIDFLIGQAYNSPGQPLSHFSRALKVWTFDPAEVSRSLDDLITQLRKASESDQPHGIWPHFKDLNCPFDRLDYPPESKFFSFSRIHLAEGAPDQTQSFEFRCTETKDFALANQNLARQVDSLAENIHQKVLHWRQDGFRVFISGQTQNQCLRLKMLCEKAQLEVKVTLENEALWTDWFEAQNLDPQLVHIIPRDFPSGLKFPDDQVIILTYSDLYGSRRLRRVYQDSVLFEKQVQALSFGELKPGDHIVHKLHGVGVYDGLKKMPIGSVDTEMIQLRYREGDKLYLPVYRVAQIQKYSGPTTPRALDKLGGKHWQVVKSKVRGQLRDVAADLLKLYAQRKQTERPPFSPPNSDFINYENEFPFEETEDQLKAIKDILGDMTANRPMDRLVCGDVGFGKTEVAMRAAFKAVQDGRQVAVIAPTTVLTFQHTETFRRRFAQWPFVIKSLNRFISDEEVKETLQLLSAGKVDIVIGTHRLLSKDVRFSDLGLLIIDEEQKFGVKHKEKIRQMKADVDTLVLSATPIPRTLNMSLMGIKDLSLINTPPVDRLPTRTFICRFDKETIRKAVLSEMNRGGQIFFIHNRVQSIEAVATELRTFLPDVRIAVAHGQMPEGQLEKAMVEFFAHDIDLLICTTIIESGMDIPKANTMFIDNAYEFGLSQLYQLRGRVGRSKERAYCYLLIPQNRKLDSDQEERLRIIQENTSLGSGIRIAQHDLELRGAGDLLGEEQSGYIGAVGYELYMELLDEAIREQKGLPAEEEELEPEINVRIPAFLPDTYIPDIRQRLYYYKALTDITDPEDLDRFEEEFKDRFGSPPEEVLNLMGLMLLRKYCKDLGVKDLSSGKGYLSLTLVEATPLRRDKVIELATRQSQKYSLTPDNRLNIKMKDLSWARIHDELLSLLRFVG